MKENHRNHVFPFESPQAADFNNILFLDVTHSHLMQEISGLLKQKYFIPYQSNSNTATGILFGAHARPMITLPVQSLGKNKESISVHFLVDTGAPTSFISKQALLAIFSVPELALIESPGLNIQGQNLLQIYQPHIGKGTIYQEPIIQEKRNQPFISFMIKIQNWNIASQKKEVEMINKPIIIQVNNYHSCLAYIFISLSNQLYKIAFNLPKLISRGILISNILIISLESSLNIIIQMTTQPKLNLKSKLICQNSKHKNEQVKIVCLNAACEQCPLLCSICLTEFTHEKCKYNLITVKELEKKDLWKMDNWPTRPEHFELKERLRKYDDLIELDELIERVSNDLKQKVNKAIDQLKANAKSRYRLLIEKRDYDIEPLRELYFQSYNVDVVQKIVHDILTWKKNVYQGIDAIKQFKKGEDRTLAIKQLDILLTNGKFPDIPTEKVAERAYKVILWQLQNLPKQIFGEKKITNTLEYLKETIEDDDGIYEGETCNGKKHGMGKYYFKNGNIYEGQMHKGVMQGRGKYIWANQNVYQGTFLQDKMSGNGKLIFANGDVYEGEFINNRACGNGKMVSHNGEAYEGQFMNNLKQGKGKQYLKNGNIYEGEFFQGKWHGRGKILFPDATIEEGIWLQNSKQ